MGDFSLLLKKTIWTSVSIRIVSVLRPCVAACAQGRLSGASFAWRLGYVGSSHGLHTTWEGRPHGLQASWRQEWCEGRLGWHPHICRCSSPVSLADSASWPPLDGCCLRLAW